MKYTLILTAVLGMLIWTPVLGAEEADPLAVYRQPVCASPPK